MSVTKHIRLLLPEENHKWIHVFQKAAGAHPFTSLPFLRAYQEALPQLQVKAMGLFEDNQLVGGFPIFERRWGPFRRAVNPPLVPYGSPFWLPNQHPNEVFYATLQYLHNTYHSAVLECTPESVNHLHLAPQHWQQHPRKTLYRTLANPAETLKSVSGKRRNAFRRASESLVFRSMAPISEKLVQLIATSYARHERSLPLLPTALTTLIQHLQAHQMATVCTAAFQSEPHEPVAMAVFLTLHECCYYWLAGTKSCQPLEPMTYLLLSAFSYFYEQGIKTIDFIGANHPSIAAFKRKFADREVPYAYVQSTSNHVLYVLEWMRNLR
ncbi:MAG: GNAT family N-acetyltransferase [Bacteroidetes Order II. Incertae sedis bacterium]|nr:GNAT family N-acetyltransferase [Bacteroidetes Order II. bacterium]